MNKDNMLKLASFLENVEPDRFRLEAWIGTIIWYEDGIGEVNPSVDLKKFTDNPYECGTTACIAGWATHLIYNEFTKEVPEEIQEIRGMFHHFLSKKYDISEYRTFNENELIPSAASRWLGISMDQANQLFYAGNKTLWQKYGSEFGFDSDLNEWNQISSKDAAEMIRGLVRGEFEFDNYEIEV